jgi:hypothetical protein
MSEQNNEELTDDVSTEALDEPKKLHKKSYIRNEDGLINGVDYVFNEDGSVNWRAMIKPEFLYPNKDWFDLRKIPIPPSAEGLEDKQLLIMLGGIKELAKLRGFISVEYDVNNVREDYVVAKCTIQWIPNYENDGAYITYQDVANATASNTDDFCLKFLETIACNRAFVRCVRNFLNIHIVGADEVDKSKNRVVEIPDSFVASNALPITAQGTLEKVVNEKLKLKDFEAFKAFLRGLWKKAQEANDEIMLSLLQEAKDWKQFKDIPAKASRVLLKVVNENSKDN